MRAIVWWRETKSDLLTFTDKKAMKILKAAISSSTLVHLDNSNKNIWKCTNHRHIPRRLPCWSRGTSSHVDKATQRKNVAAPRSGVYWRRRTEPAQTLREGRGLAAPVRHRGAWISEEEEQDRIPSKTCVLLTSGGSEIESSQDICRSFSNRPLSSALE